MTKEARMTNDETLVLRASSFPLFLLFSGSPDSREDQVQRSCFQPQLSCVSLWLRNCAGNHSQKMFCFPRFLFASTDALQKLLLRNRVVSLDIVCANAGSDTH